MASAQVDSDRPGGAAALLFDVDGTLVDSVYLDEVGVRGRLAPSAAAP